MYTAKPAKSGSGNSLRPFRWMAAAFLFFLLPAVAAAQDSTRLDLPDAISYALKANRDARNAQLDVENSAYQIAEVRSRALPQINGNGSLTYNPLLQQSALPNIFGPNPNPDETILVAFGQKWNTNFGLSLSQNLFDQSVITGLKAARTTREFYRVNAQLTEEQIIEQVATSYYRLQVQRQKTAVLDSTIANAEQILKVLTGQYENGLARKIDVDRIAVNISNLKSQRQQLLIGIEQQTNQLKFLMGMEITGAVYFPDVDVEAIEPRAVALTDSVDLSGRTEFQLLKRQEELLQYQKEAFKSEYYPSLSLSANYAYQGIGNKLPWFKGRSQGVNWFDYSAISLNLRIPIFNGFATRSRVRQADISIRKLQEDQQYTRLALNLGFENAKAQINNSLITINSQIKNLELAREVFSNTENNYNNGLASLTDLLDAENSLTAANNNYSQALLDYRLAEIQLLKARGELNTLISNNN